MTLIEATRTNQRSTTMTSLTVRELMDLLASEDPDAEVRLMTQPSCPFEYATKPYLWTPEQQLDPNPDSDDPDDVFMPYGDDGSVVYLVEGEQLGYGTKAAWQA